MKKIISCILTAIMLIGMFAMPVFAKDASYSAEKAKNLISEISGVKADKFSANLNPRYDKANGQMWNIYYGDQDINVSAGVDADSGELINYYCNDNYYPGSKQINVPAYTRDELKDTAAGFLKKYAADKYDKVDKNVDYQYGYYSAGNGSPTYTYHFSRKLEQTGSMGGGVDIVVDSSTGKVTSYYIDWTDISKVDTNGLLSNDEAAKKLKDVYGTYLVQQQIWRDNKPEKKLMYAPANNAGIYPLATGINAKTGEPVSYDGQAYESAREEYKIDSVNELAPLGKMDDKKARDFAEAYIKSMGKDPAKFTLNVNITEDYDNKKMSVYNINGNYGDKNGNSNISAVIEAATGKVLNLNYGEWNNQDKPADDVKDIGIDKAVQIAKDRISKIKLPFGNTLLVSGKDYNYSVTFIMFEDGVLYPTNTANVSFTNDGEISGFNVNYGDPEKADTSGIITMEDANAKLSKYQKLQLTFIIPRDQYTGNITGDPIPVYQLSYLNGFGIDAKTGEFVGYDAKNQPTVPGEEFDPYQTIKGDKNEKILKIFVDTSIMPQPVPVPGDALTVGNAAAILRKVYVPDYYYKPVTYDAQGGAEEDTSGQTEAIAVLKSYGIIKEDVKPADKVTRAQLALWLSRAMGYDKITNSDIVFDSVIKDIDGLDKEVRNSVNIMTSLKIMSAADGQFAPNDSMTFSDFCAAVYSAMKNM